jgi:ubiquinone/menaquinone biosynthesis C-methylase UbiE
MPKIVDINSLKCESNGCPRVSPVCIRFARQASPRIWISGQTGLYRNGALSARYIQQSGQRLKIYRRRSPSHLFHWFSLLLFRRHKESLVTYLDPIDFDTPDFGDLYDELPLWSAPFGLWILDRAPVRSGLTILDIGSGTGFLSIELAERCGPATTVIAVDPWAAAMERLRRKIKQRRLTNIRLLEQDAAAVDLPEDSVDVIMSNLGVNNFEDPAAVLRTCSRIAKPGATFLLTTNLVGHMAEFYEVYRKVLLQTGQSDRVAALESHINHRATTDSVRKLLESASFKIADVVTDSFRLRFADGSSLLRHYFVRLGFLQAWIEVATVGMAQKTFETLEKELNAVASERGEIALTIPMACFVARKELKGQLDAKGAAGHQTGPGGLPSSPVELKR